MQSGRIARLAPKFAGAMLDELYGRRCLRPPALAPPALRAHVLTACVPCSHRHSFDQQTARRPSPCPKSSLASAIPSDCCRDRCRPASHCTASDCTASRPVWHGHLSSGSCTGSKVGMEARMTALWHAHSTSHTVVLQRVRVCHAVIWLCVPSDACAVCARATRAISSFRSRHHLGLAGRLRMYVLMGSVCCE